MFLSINDVIDTLILILATDCSSVFFEFVLVLDLFCNLIVFYNGDLSKFHRVKKLFLDHFLLRFFILLRFFFGSFLLLSFLGHHFNKSLFVFIIRTCLSCSNHCVYEHSENRNDSKDENDNNHGLVVTLCGFSAKLVSSIRFILSSEDNVTPLF